MHHIAFYRPAFWAALVLIFSGAQAPLATKSFAENHNASDQDASSCVLLRNHNVLFGKAIQQGDQVLVKRANGSRLQLSRREVLCWAKSVEDLYKYRVDHRMANTANEHMETARWCMQYELFEGALAELNAAEQLRIDQTEVIRLKQQLYRAVIAKQKSKIRKTQVADEPTTNSFVAQASYEQATSPMQVPGAEKLASNALDPNTLRRFVTVQPTLVNRCGGCHNSRSDVKWQLHLPRDGSRLSSRLTRENLIATLAHVSFEAPLESDLRLRSLDGHAGIKNTLGPRDAVAVRSLEFWLENARPAGSALSLAKRDYEKKSSSESTISEPLIGESADTVESDLDASVVQAAGVEAISPTDQKADAKRVARLPVANPFDPEIFNRQMHNK